ncbi:MAG: hypothetical protein GTO24_08470 [candidate division Zixibacteria bacterium]|nr:hypothetical protein [candidate division Zixibacteria bacterium]
MKNRGRMTDEDRVNLVAALTRQVRENLNACLPTHAETVFTGLVQDQPNRGSDFTGYLVKLLNYWSRVLDVTFGLRYDCPTFVEYLKQ